MTTIHSWPASSRPNRHVVLLPSLSPQVGEEGRWPRLLRGAPRHTSCTPLLAAPQPPSPARGEGYRALAPRLARCAPHAIIAATVARENPPRRKKTHREENHENF